MSSTKSQCWAPWHSHAILSGFTGKQVLPCSAFSMETCWHDQVSTVPTSLPPLLTFLSILYLTRQTQPPFTRSICVCIFPGHVTVAATARNEGHQAQTGQSTASHSFAPHPAPPTEMVKALQSLCLLRNPFLTLPQTPACTFWLQTVD